MPGAFPALFSVSTFEALRSIRLYRLNHPDLPTPEVVSLIKKIEIGALNYEAGVELDAVVSENADPRVAPNFYKQCVEALLPRNDVWFRTITIGRKKFIQKLARDEAQCFDWAGLLEDPPSDEIVLWWDNLQASARQLFDAEKLERGRYAERLSLKYERARLQSLGINLRPIWMAIEDNTVGYDIQSYDIGTVEPVSRLIEVKASSGRPVRFHLTRTEWDTARKFGSSYVFHIWKLDSEELVERSPQEIISRVPTDGDRGKWTHTIIDLSDVG